MCHAFENAPAALIDEVTDAVRLDVLRPWCARLVHRCISLRYATYTGYSLLTCPTSGRTGIVLDSCNLAPPTPTAYHIVA